MLDGDVHRRRKRENIENIIRRLSDVVVGVTNRVPTVRVLKRTAECPDVNGCLHPIAGRRGGQGVNI